MTVATGHVDTSGALHVYAIDDNLGLWALHQDPDTPWNDDGSPNWSPYIPLDTGVAAVVADPTPADAPTLFALDGGDFSLRLHAQDPTTGLWSSGPVLRSAPQANEVVRFRTEVNLIDANGVVIPGLAVSVQAAEGSSGCELAAGGTTVMVDAQGQTQLTTDDTGKLTVAALTTAGLVAPSLLVTAEGMTAPVTVSLASPVHTYLSGQGTLNPTNPGGPLPVFDAAGATLAAATVGGQPLAPAASGNTQLAGVAAQAIRTTAAVGLGQTPANVSGYSASFDPSNPSFQTHTTAAEVAAHRASLPEAGLGSVWGDIEKWADDVWKGSRTGSPRSPTSWSTSSRRWRPSPSASAT